MPAARLGLGYEFDGVRKLVDVVGPSFAQEIFFTARQFSAAEAQTMGLINRMVPKEDLLAYVTQYADTIAANALLKTLEEPPGDVRFVLATEASHMLLPTIRSRCLAHTMKWPEADEALPWLTNQGVPAAVAQDLLRSAGGRPADVLRQAESGLSPDWWAHLPKAMRQGDARHLADLSPAQAIDALQKLCHDLVLRQSGAALLGPGWQRCRGRAACCGAHGTAALRACPQGRSAMPVARCPHAGWQWPGGHPCRAPGRRRQRCG